MKKRLALAIAFLAVAFISASPKAQELSSGLSTDLIQITSNFTGTDIVLFGVIESPSGTMPNDNDIVVVIRGPLTDVTVRRKERIAGLWLNRQQISITGLPGYYFLASTRPLAEIAPPSTLDRFQLGADHLESEALSGADPKTAADFRAAAIRSYIRGNLYRESTVGIEFLSRTLFRARVPIPASVPSGQYKAEAYLFSNGNVISAQSTPLYVDKTGVERRLYDYAYQKSLPYGLAAVVMALILGWLGYALFRQEA